MTSFGYCILVVLGLILNESVLCNGGVTSSFVRKVEKTIDMPLDSDVFSVPPGYNAPQQVSSNSPFYCFLICIFFHLELLTNTVDASLTLLLVVEFFNGYIDALFTFFSVFV